VKKSVFVDVKSSFREDVRGRVLEYLRSLDPEAWELFAWSERGSEAARVYAVEAGVEDLFSGFLPKPNVFLDEHGVDEWPDVSVQSPELLGAYTTESITVLEVWEAIRKRPGLYVGTTENPNHMLHWAFRERLGHIEETAGPRTVLVRLLPGDALEIVDDWPRYPVSEAGLKAACSELQRGFELPILAALSRRFEAEVWADGTWVRTEFEEGRLIAGPFESEGALGSGTRLRFVPDPEIFGDTRTDPVWLATRLKELSVLDAGVRLTLENGSQTQTFFAPKGLADWVAGQAHTDAPVARGVVRASQERCEVAWAWVEAAESDVRGWVNGVHTREGGTHVEALCEFLADHAPSPQHRLVAAVHVNMPHPRFKSPIKGYLDSPEIAPLVRLAAQTGLFEGPQSHGFELRW
jgi:hypothetical protein